MIRQQQEGLRFDLPRVSVGQKKPICRIIRKMQHLSAIHIAVKSLMIHDHCCTQNLNNLDTLSANGQYSLTANQLLKYIGVESTPKGLFPYK